jgi:hypothetical protein
LNFSKVGEKPDPQASAIATTHFAKEQTARFRKHSRYAAAGKFNPFGLEPKVVA